MNNLNSETLLNSLRNVHWDVAIRTYGNNHSSLIGLLVDWWVSLSPKNHRVLEGGPTNGYQQKGLRGQCDALLCSEDIPVGVLEVEGTRHELTVRKVGKFFNAIRHEFKALYFGIILFYSYEAYGHGENRRFIDPLEPSAMREILRVTKRHSEKSLIVITLNKKYQRQHIGVRSWNEYYMGQVEKIDGHLFKKGRELKRLSLCKNINS